MGGGVLTFICDGDDVIHNLNAVFQHPNSRAYQYAQANNHFGAVPNAPGNYNALIDAYRQAGLVVPPGWVNYLTALGTVTSPDPQQGPQNIYTIAQFRYNGLLQGKKMKTKVHDHGRVDTRPGTGGDPEEIDSPCPTIG
jgi:hypothetical protein